MARIDNITEYPVKETPISEDFVLGSDSEDSGKTVNFKVGTLGTAAQALEGYTESGTKSAGNLIVTIGDYNNSSTGQKIVIDQANAKTTFFGSAYFDGAQFFIKNTFSFGFSVDSLSSDRTQILQDQDGTIALLSDIPGISDFPLTINTGVITGGLVTVNEGDPAKFDVASGTGYILDWTNPLLPKGTKISWNDFIAVSLPDISNDLFTSIYIVESTTPGIGELELISDALSTPQDRRQKIQLEPVIHIENTISSIGTNSQPAYEITETLLDYILELGTINSGNQVLGNGANLELDKAIGSSTLPFININNEPQNPAKKTNVAQTAFTWTKSYQDGSNGFTFVAGNTEVDPDKWDNGSGTLDNVANNKFTIKHFIFFGVNENFNMTYGQTEYSSLADAKLNIASETRNTSPLLNSGICTTVLIIKKGVTDLAAAILAGDAEFVDCPSSGNAGGAASVGNFITQDTNQLTGNTGDKTWDGNHIFNSEFILANSSTVAGLPSGTQGQIAWVTDATSITYRATATGGGSGIAIVFFEGTNWIYH